MSKSVKELDEIEFRSAAMIETYRLQEGDIKNGGTVRNGKWIPFEDDENYVKPYQPDKWENYGKTHEQVSIIESKQEQAEFDDNMALELATMDLEIKELELKIADLKNRRKPLDKAKALYDLKNNIKKYEEAHESHASHYIGKLVICGETFEQYNQRTSRDKKTYEEGGDTRFHYLTWLYKVRDPRVLNTVLYVKHWENK